MKPAERRKALLEKVQATAAAVQSVAVKAEKVRVEVKKTEPMTALGKTAIDE